MLERRSSLSRSRPGEAALEVSERLKERRRRGRRRGRLLLVVFVLVLLGSFIWLTWQPSVRISHVSIRDPGLQALVTGQLSGSYLGIVPHDSFFFVPEHAIRAAIIDANAGIQAVSIQHDGLTGLTILLDERVPVAQWCGLQKTEGVEEYCYLFDATGYVYAAAGVATGTPTLNSFVVYDALMGDTLEPLHATLSHAKAMPDAFDFARKVGALGSLVATITFRTDEADLLLQSGTRLTYVVGSEEAAFADLMSAKSNLNLTDGSLDYVDLRFPGKVYLKKKGE